MVGALKKIRLGELLIREGYVTPEQIEQAFAVQQKTGVKLGRILVEQGILKDEALARALAWQFDLPFIDLTQYSLDPALSKKLPESYARRFRSILLKEEEEGFLVGITDPLDLAAIDQVQAIFSKKIQLALVKESDLLQRLDQVYRRTEQITELASAIEDEAMGQSLLVSKLKVEVGDPDAPVIQLLQCLFEDALQIGASDIHIEPDASLLRLRLRVDGHLQEQLVKELSIARAIVARLKVMANLDIAERRLPQDGRFHLRIRDQLVDVRLSSMPTQYGESVVLRLLVKSTGLLRLDSVGMTPELLQKFERLLSVPHGLILVTGPTGSGKTTTLNAALQLLNRPDTKVMTVEDPIEYSIDRVIKIQVNEKIGLTFSVVLRSILRQDPDIILVGEMRDAETASVAIRSALTGHLVLSTLHTNDAASSAIRLMDMGINGFLLASTLRGILTQRLIRRVCKECKTDAVIDQAQKNWLKTWGLDDPSLSFSSAKGCMNCQQTGYRGRVGVFELLELTPEMQEALRLSDTDNFLQLAKKALQGQTLLDAAMHLAKMRLTSLDEVIQLAGEWRGDLSI